MTTLLGKGGRGWKIGKKRKRMERKRAGEEAEAAGRPEMQEAAGSVGGEALCLSCSLGPRTHNVHHFL